MAKNLPVAEVQTPTAVLDIGSPEARSHLIAGWGNNESVGSTSFAWGLGRESSLQWFVDERRDLQLTFRCWPFWPSGDALQTLTFVINGHSLTRLALRAAPTVYSIDIPAWALVSGWNTITVRYSQQMRRTADSRAVAVAWDWLRTAPRKTTPEPPRARGEGKSAVLSLPVGSRLDYFVYLSPGAELVVDGIEAWEDGATDPPVLEVVVQGADGAVPQRVELAPETPTRRHVLPLPVDAPRASRVSLRARRSRDDEADHHSGLELRRPLLRGGNGPLGLSSFDWRKGSGAPQGRAAMPNVIVYLIDTLRADHLGCHGYDRGTSPEIDRFARDAVLFSRAVAQSAWTRASVASIFTGLLPEAHRANGTEDALSADAVTLAERLSEAGYETAGFTTNGNVSSLLGFDQGFDQYELLAHGADAVLSDEVNARVFEWLTGRRRDRPFFLYVHTVDPHAPYAPPEPYREKFAPGVDLGLGEMKVIEDLKQKRRRSSEEMRRDLISLYDAEVASNDASFGAFLDELRRLGLYDSSLIVLVSDHGEEFHDHGRWEHGHTLYRELLEVPLIIRFPKGWLSGTVPSVVPQHVDLLPTIVAYATGREPTGIQGRSLLPWLDGRAKPPFRPAISYLDLRGNRLESVEFDDRKLIRNLHGFTDPPHPREEMFDLASDPEERINIAYVQRTEAGFLRSLLLAERSNGFAALQGELVTLPETVKEHLRALGYTQ